MTPSCRIPIMLVRKDLRTESGSRFYFCRARACVAIFHKTFGKSCTFDMGSCKADIQGIVRSGLLSGWLSHGVGVG